MKVARFLLLLLCIGSFGCNAKVPVKSAHADYYPPKQDISDTFDFGTVKEGAKYSHAFIMSNTFAKTLHIQDVSSSCGCTVSSTKKKDIPPGGSSEIMVTFDSTGYDGEVTQFVYVRTDSLDKPIQKFIIKAFVVR